MQHIINTERMRIKANVNQETKSAEVQSRRKQTENESSHPLAFNLNSDNSELNLKHLTSINKKFEDTEPNPNNKISSKQQRQTLKSASFVATGNKNNPTNGVSNYKPEKGKILIQMNPNVITRETPEFTQAILYKKPMLGDSNDNHIGAERQEVLPSFSELTDSRIKDQDFDLVNIDSDD